MERKKKKGERIALAVALLRSGGEIYISTFPTRRRFSPSFFFIFFFPSTTFRPGKILPRVAQRTARRMRTNLCEFLNLLFRHPRLFLSFCTLVFVSFITLKTDRCLFRAVDYYSSGNKIFIEDLFEIDAENC